MSREKKTEKTSVAQQLLTDLKITDFAAFKTQIGEAITPDSTKALKILSTINPGHDGQFTLANQYRLICLSYFLVEKSIIQKTGIFETIHNYKRSDMRGELSVRDILFGFFVDILLAWDPITPAKPTFAETVETTLCDAAQFFVKKVGVATQMIKNTGAEATEILHNYIRCRFFSCEQAKITTPPENNSPPMPTPPF